MRKSLSDIVLLSIRKKVVILYYQSLRIAEDKGNVKKAHLQQEPM